MQQVVEQQRELRLGLQIGLRLLERELVHQKEMGLPEQSQRGHPVPGQESNQRDRLEQERVSIQILQTPVPVRALQKQEPALEPQRD